MVRTNPHHDWDEPRRSGEPQRGGASEWESLRNELVALLDQVEDQVASARQTGPSTPMALPRTAAAIAAQPAPVATRHNEALRSVRHAVDRLADRGEPAPRARRESVAEAISQIRARQTGAAQTPVNSRPDEAARDELSGFAKAVSELGQRIESFETRISARMDTLGQSAEISEQVAQLSEVIEMLASAVGETGQVKRIEAQLSNIASLVGENGSSAAKETAERIAQLSETIERLTAHQIETSGRDQQSAAQAQDHQAATMRQIEESVRNIYERMDALEHARSAGAPDIEAIGRDMGALTAAIAGSQKDSGTILARIDDLQQRIVALSGQERDEASVLRESVEVLRSVVAETIDPRFAALEGKLDALGSARNLDNASAVDTTGLETQIRSIALTVEDTASQLQKLAALYDADTGRDVTPDFDVLADKIVERTREGQAPARDGIAKADLTALEGRLAKLFAMEGATAGSGSEPLSGVRDSIAQVDNRLARLEEMLNGKQDAKSAEPAAETPRPQKPVRSDIMPSDPVSGAPRKVLGEDIAPLARPETRPAPGFRIDPETVDRPVKPRSSLAADDAKPFAAARPDAVEPERPGPVQTASQSNFIEAARRSARQQVVPEDTGGSKSLIARALSRFQKTEADQENAAEQAPTAEPAVPAMRDAPRSKNSIHEVDPFVGEGPIEESEHDAQPGFIARNRRALLLGAALVVVIALAVPLALNRASGPASTQAPETAAPATTTEPAPAETESQPVEAVDTVSSLMSSVRVVDADTALSAATLDSTMLAAPTPVDPIRTAGLHTPPDRYIDRTTTASTGSLVSSTQLPEIRVPETIEPDLLRAAAESGNARAQFEVGAILTEGHVVTQDLEQAAAWYERSAAQGFAPAQYRLGNLYESGRGVERDLELARLWYQRAAESGNRMSMHNLASLYAGGELEQQDFAAAAHWFEEAAARGMTDSQFNLGMLYARGLGVEQDFEDSYVWFSLAARSGDEDAAAAREDVARSLDPETVQRLNDTVSGWIPAEIDLAANFAPIGTWDENFDPGQAIANRDVILRVQMLLGKLGFEVGQPDGIAGPRTREAIMEFERATGMSERGEVNPRLLAVLGSQPV